MKLSLFASTCLFTLLSFGWGCSTSNTSSTNNENPAGTPTTIPAKEVGSGDSELTVEKAAQNVDAYKGKRVRWFGQSIRMEWTSYPETKIIRGIYINDPNLERVDGELRAPSGTAATKDALHFSAQIKLSDKVDSHSRDAASVKLFQEFSRGWITGTIEGTDTVSVRVQSPTGKVTTTSKKIPLLKDATFEKDNNKH